MTITVQAQSDWEIYDAIDNANQTASDEFYDNSDGGEVFQHINPEVTTADNDEIQTLVGGTTDNYEIVIDENNSSFGEHLTTALNELEIPIVSDTGK